MLLTHHLADSGQMWHDDFIWFHNTTTPPTGQLKIDGGFLYVDFNRDAEAYSTAIPPTANYGVEFAILERSIVTVVGVRFDPIVKTGYAVRVLGDHDQGVPIGQVYIQTGKMNPNGTFTSFVTNTAVESAQFIFRLEVVNSNISVFKNNVLFQQHTDTTVTQAGCVYVYMQPACQLRYVRAYPL